MSFFRRGRLPFVPTPEPASQALSYATDLVRTRDLDAFWSIFAFSRPARTAFIALRALNVELSTVNDNVSNASTGRIRYSWWRDAVASAFKRKPVAHPVIQLLSALPQLSSLSPYHFTRIIDARESHLLRPTFTSLQDLSEYAAGTQAPLLYLQLQLLESAVQSLRKSDDQSPLPHSIPFIHTGSHHSHDHESADHQMKMIPDALTLDHAASHFAAAVTIAILLRSIPHQAARRINPIPLEIAARHGLSDESLFRYGAVTPGLREAVATLVGIAEAELRTARSCLVNTTGVPRRLAPAFSTIVPAREYIEKLQNVKIHFDVFHAHSLRADAMLPFYIWRSLNYGV